MKKVLLLFGASGDLGSAAAEYFLSRDYDNYYFFARKIKGIKAENKNINEITVDDLTDENSVKEAFAKIKKERSALYFLFSAIGGYSGGKPIAQTDYDDFKSMIEMNVSTSFLLSKHFSALAAETAGGAICFTSAMSSFGNGKNNAAYALSKNALNYLVASLSEEGKSLNFSANAVAPNIIDTPQNRKWVEHEDQMVKPAEIAEAVEYLFTYREFLSGNIIKMNGSRSASK